MAPLSAMLIGLMLLLLAASRAAHAQDDEGAHRYEVRISEQPITHLPSFLRGRPAKAATDALDGPYALMLPVDVPQGHWVEGTIGDLSAETAYYVAVRAVDRRNRAGPLATASITTTERTFATVSQYYTCSPGIAERVRQTPWLAALVRADLGLGLAPRG